jgi:16S rRNA (guanine966-N2)-methyltransferase
MSLRVISGRAKGRRLQSVAGDRTRPITDRVKEALFDIIGADVADSNWWDMFAGTGAVGIEALSRGATAVRFTEFGRTAVETIRANLEATKLADRGEVRRADAFSVLAASPDIRFQYIYIAPPQYKDLWSKALSGLDRNIDWLADDGWTIGQIAPSEYRELELENIREFDRRKYGTTLLVFFSRTTA